MNQEIKSSSLFNKEIHPKWQFAGMAIAYLFIVLVNKLLVSMAIFEADKLFAWSLSATFLLFFAIFNSILSLSYKEQGKYWLYSVIAFAFLLILFFFGSWLLTGIHINNAKSYKFIFFIFTFGYLVIISIIRAMNKIVSIAQKQDKRLRGED